MVYRVRRKGFAGVGLFRMDADVLGPAIYVLVVGKWSIEVWSKRAQAKWRRATAPVEDGL